MSNAFSRTAAMPKFAEDACILDENPTWSACPAIPPEAPTDRGSQGSQRSSTRAVLTPLVLSVVAACMQSPEAKRADLIRGEASTKVDAIKDRAAGEAAPLDREADSLRYQEKVAGGYEGKRLGLQADALETQAKRIREQASEQGKAVNLAADARIVETLRGR